MVFVAGVFSIFLNCTLVKSLVLMKLKGWCFNVVVDFGTSGKGGGGGPFSCDLVNGVSFATIETCFSSNVDMFNSDFVLCNFTFVLEAAMLRRYSEGLISEFESLSAFGNLGGINGNTSCLLTKCGPELLPLLFASRTETCVTCSSEEVVTTTVFLSPATSTKRKQNF